VSTSIVWPPPLTCRVAVGEMVQVEAAARSASDRCVQPPGLSRNVLAARGVGVAQRQREKPGMHVIERAGLKTSSPECGASSGCGGRAAATESLPPGRRAMSHSRRRCRW